MSSLKYTFFLTVCVIAIYAFISFDIKQNEEVQKTEKLIPLDFRIESLVLKKKDRKAIVIDFSSEQVAIKSPPGHPPDVEAIDRLVGGLRGFILSKKIAKKNIAKDIYGLNSPEYILDLVSASSNIRIEVGVESPTSYNTYIRSSSHEDIYLGSQYLHLMLNKNIFDLRHKKIFNIEQKKLISMRFYRSSELIYKIEKNSQGQWFNKTDLLRSKDVEAYLKELEDLAAISLVSREQVDAVLDRDPVFEFKFYYPAKTERVRFFLNDDGSLLGLSNAEKRGLRIPLASSLRFSKIFKR